MFCDKIISRRQIDSNEAAEIYCPQCNYSVTFVGKPRKNDPGGRAEYGIRNHAKIRGYGLHENTNRKVALRLLPVKGLENMPHCSFLKK